MAERALADADQADARRRGGDVRALLGVPLAVKDTEDVAGEVTRWGTAAFTEPAERDGELVSRLRSAGAVLIGKTNLPELAIIGCTEGPAFGVTRNPWDLDATPGGSSGGSAAAVAAGLAPGATASDGAGSIRIPAANCGLVGLKPQRGRIPLSPFAEHWHGMSVLGFEARSVADAALLLDVGAGTAGMRRYVGCGRAAARTAAGGAVHEGDPAGPRGSPASARRGGDRRAPASAGARRGRARPRVPAGRRQRARGPLPRGNRGGRGEGAAPGPAAAAHARIRQARQAVSQERRRAGKARLRRCTPSGSTGFSRTSTCS